MMATAAEQEQLWYKVAMGYVVGHLPRREFNAQEQDEIKSLVHAAVRLVIEQHLPVSLMDWWNLSEEFKTRALENVRRGTSL